jgi:hypothetical protein
MPIGANRVYNDPTIGAAFANLAQIFAPPSGGDLAGYATAKAKREEAERLAQLFTAAQQDGFNQTTFDRMGQATGQWTPSTGYYGVDTNAATVRRGQDIGAQTELSKQRLANEGELAKLYASPVTVGENATVYLPGQTAAATGLPQALSGQVSAGQGETIFRPDGSTLAGAPKPLSESEWQAAQNERLRVAGSLTDQMMLDTITGEKTPVQAVGPDGKPVFMSPGAAVRQGAQPYVQQGSQAKPSNAVALMPDGQTRVPAVQDPDGRWVHAQTGQVLPDGIQIFGLPQATGTAADVGLAPTTANATQANNQEAEVTRALNLLDIYEQTVRSNPGAIGFAGLIRGTAQNVAATAQDLAASFGKTAPEVAEAAAEIRQGLQGVAPEFFDPSIPEIEFLQGTLAYSLARTENPSGEVSRQAFERALERVKGGGLLANTQSALAAIGANRKVLETQLQGIRTLRAPGTGRTDTSFQPPAGGETIRRYNPATGKLE